jgi:hypothetical protein
VSDPVPPDNHNNAWSIFGSPHKMDLLLAGDRSIFLAKNSIKNDEKKLKDSTRQGWVMLIS